MVFKTWLCKNALKILSPFYETICFTEINKASKWLQIKEVIDCYHLIKAPIPLKTYILKSDATISHRTKAITWNNLLTMLTLLELMKHLLSLKYLKYLYLRIHTIKLLIPVSNITQIQMCYKYQLVK